MSFRDDEFGEFADFPLKEDKFDPKNCTACPLARRGVKVCPGEIHSTIQVDRPQVMAIAEAPGIEENKYGRPLVGASGEEARHHLNINGISRLGVFLTNICLCNPPNNRDPSQEEINICTAKHLKQTVKKLKPKFIIAMGRLAIRHLLGNVDVEMTHGIPRSTTIYGHDTIVIPTYHPAAGMHSPERMLLFHTDMRLAGQVIKGEIPPHPPVDEWEGREEYKLVTDDSLFPLSEYNLEFYMEETPFDKFTVAVDTEWARRAPWCLSFSCVPGMANVVMADQYGALAKLQAILARPDVVTVLHNAVYDLPVLRQMGIYPANTVDTMVMAYLLQNEPQGLKPLAYRHAGMKMVQYKDMVQAATAKLAMDYLQAAVLLDYPNPDPVLEWQKGEPHVRKPQNIKGKIKRILKAVEAKGIDPAEAWKNVKEGKEPVHLLFGPMQAGELWDIDFDEAVHYAARDADATIRVYPKLLERIVSLRLEDTLHRDMRMLPMVIDMMANGMPADQNALHELSGYFQGKLDLLQRKMQLTVGKYLDGKAVNPASYPQMAELIYDKLKLHEKGGQFKSKKGAGKKSTEESVLKRYTTLHPVVQDILDWRGYKKLQSTYSGAYEKLVGEDGRVHPTIKITRTSTGRLSCANPNLMAVPTRTEEGRKIRNCFVTDEGNTLLSGDYSQVEMRCAAHMANDRRMLEIFRKDEDVHAQTASWMFGIPIPQLDSKQHRYPAKRIGFGILFMVTADGLKREMAVAGLDWSLSQCQDAIKSWFDVYEDIAAFMKETGAYTKRKGYVRDMWGRIRYIPGIRSTNKWIRMEAERQAGNAPIQSSAQGVIKQAMGDLVPIYPQLDIKPLLQIHDDIIWEMREDMVDNAKLVIKLIMESSAPAGFRVPLKVDFKQGRRWGSMK